MTPTLEAQARKVVAVIEHTVYRHGICYLPSPEASQRWSDDLYAVIEPALSAAHAEGARQALREAADYAQSQGLAEGSGVAAWLRQRAEEGRTP